MTTCEVEECKRPPQRKKKLCGLHLGSHDPTPEHHVAADRTCLRCRETFPSAWSGDRVCGDCRQKEYWGEKDAVKRGHTSRFYDSPLEPIETPGLS